MPRPAKFHYTHLLLSFPDPLIVIHFVRPSCHPQVPQQGAWPPLLKIFEAFPFLFGLLA